MKDIVQCTVSEFFVVVFLCFYNDTSDIVISKTVLKRFEWCSQGTSSCSRRNYFLVTKGKQKQIVSIKRNYTRFFYKKPVYKKLGLQRAKN